MCDDTKTPIERYQAALLELTAARGSITKTRVAPSLDNHDILWLTANGGSPARVSLKDARTILAELKEIFGET